MHRYKQIVNQHNSTEFSEVWSAQSSIVENSVEKLKLDVICKQFGVVTPYGDIELGNYCLMH